MSPQEELTNKKGSALVLAMLMISLLGLTALWSAQTSTTESKIARNDREHKIAFHASEGGAEAAIAFLEEAEYQEHGFLADPTMRYCEETSVDCYQGNIAVPTSTVSTSHNSPLPPKFPGSSLQQRLDDEDNSIVRSDNTTKNRFPTLDNARFYIPKDNPTPPTTYVITGGIVKKLPGAGLGMVAGDEGEGKGLANSGSGWFGEVRSRHVGQDNSVATINIGWLHVY